MIKLFENFTEIKDFVFLSWHGMRFSDNIQRNDVFILEKDFGESCILYNGYVQKSSYTLYSRIMTEKEKEDYIYNNLKKISVFNKYRFDEIFYKDLIKKIERDKLSSLRKLQNIEKYKNVDPYGEEDWDEDIREGYVYDNNGKYTILINNEEDIEKYKNIDPYGEENWDEDNKNIDWTKIKIVHPTKNDINKKVLIIKDSQYYDYYGGDFSNPKDVIGTILKTKKLDESGYHYPVEVLWKNGSINTYNYSDLTLIEEI